ncbi:MAG TPA: VOC family protein [Allosphingosinicella sp.]|nr:VOC family protein [Allosphingosinicella sp.]
MLDHIGITVSDVKRSKAFYALALKPLGIAVQLLPTPEMMQAGHEGYGFGEEGKPYFWFGSGSSPIHIAFAAGTRSDVDAFHQAAIAAGGRDNGAPGVREHYHPSYYGAFVLDPDGNNIEAVCHRPE